MAVTHDDVRHVAALARIAVSEAQLDHIVAELNGILGHIDALSQVDTSAVDRTLSPSAASTPLRGDSSGPLPLLAPRESFAPVMRDGFFIVPRLSTHEESVDSAP